MSPKILVSHECPIAMLPHSRAFNDFDYALVHLFEQYPRYYEYFDTALRLYNREVLLDNSIFELGKAFDAAKFKQWIEKLQPTCYVIPDALQDSPTTIKQADEWLRTYGSDGHAATTRKIGVVQGNTFQNLVECYKFMVDNVDQIAISFDYEYYLVTGLGKTNLEKYCTGRQRFIADLIDEGIWNWRKPIHLLGCGLAREFRWYVDQGITNIRSCDTSNPIVAALEGMKYDGEFGLNTKSKTKLADLIDVQPTPEQIQLIEWNVEQFKLILRRRYC